MCSVVIFSLFIYRFRRVIQLKQISVSVRSWGDRQSVLSPRQASIRQTHYLRVHLGLSTNNPNVCLHSRAGLYKQGFCLVGGRGERVLV